ncbi:MAG: hypothetical protein IJN50_05980 [Clostridia bacterium]|nr:hypothetical protein [Clostridia bacterium]
MILCSIPIIILLIFLAVILFLQGKKILPSILLLGVVLIILFLIYIMNGIAA